MHQRALLALALSLAVAAGCGDSGTPAAGDGAADAPPGDGAPPDDGGLDPGDGPVVPDGGLERCPPGVQPCGLPGEPDCPPNYYCITGCCQHTIE
jgi:hypothetical protein